MPPAARGAEPPESARLLQRMDLNMCEMWRENARNARGGVVLDLPDATLIRIPAAQAFHNSVLVRGPVDAAALLEAAEEFYDGQASGFSIWLRAHEEHGLPATLENRGFQHGFTLPAMAMLADPGTRCDADGLEIRAVTDERGRGDYAEVTRRSYAVFNLPEALPDSLFHRPESLSAPHVQGFVGYADDGPVAASLVCVTHAVAGINWVGTVPEARGKRAAEALVWAAIRDGFAKGADMANLQASPMGRGVYERMGFLTPSEYRMYIRDA